MRIESVRHLAFFRFFREQQRWTSTSVQVGREGRSARPARRLAKPRRSMNLGNGAPQLGANGWQSGFASTGQRTPK